MPVLDICALNGIDENRFGNLLLAMNHAVHALHFAVQRGNSLHRADFALQNENYSDKLKIVGEPFTEELYGVAVKKGNSEVLDAINAGLEKVLDTRDYKKLEEKWLR